MKPVLALFALASALLLSVAMPAAASAQCRLCESPTTGAPSLIPDAERIDLEVTAALDFDQIILMGYGSGTAMLGTDGTRIADGAATEISNRAMVGTVVVRGKPGRRIDVGLPARIELVSPDGSRISLDAIESDMPADPRLDERGEFRFSFGGRLELEGGLEGEFSGDLPISVDYL